MYMHFKSEQEKKTYEANLKKTTVFLAQVASLLRSKGFATWYSSTESRFAWATGKVFAKLRKDLMFQINQALPRMASETEKQRILAFADLCDGVVAAAEEKHKIENKKKDKQFSFPRGADAAGLIFEFLSHGDTRGLIRDLPDSFYVWNGVASLVTFARARETLSVSTGEVIFEKLLSGLKEDYMVNGYPHDLLAFDAHDIRARVPVKALLMRTEYCSTQLVKLDEELLPFSDGKVVLFNHSTKQEITKAA